MFDAITGELAAGRDVAIAGFGKFTISDRAAREGRNPATGETIQIAASRAAKFSAAAALKAQLNAWPLARPPGPGVLARVLAAADDRPRARRAAAWGEHLAAGGGDLPRARRAGRHEHEAVTLEQHERLGHEVRAPVPRRGTYRRDLTGANGLAVVLVLSVAEGAKDDALLGGHNPPKLPTALTGWLDKR